MDIKIPHPNIRMGYERNPESRFAERKGVYVDRWVYRIFSVTNIAIFNINSRSLASRNTRDQLNFPVDTQSFLSRWERWARACTLHNPEYLREPSPQTARCSGHSTMVTRPSASIYDLPSAAHQALPSTSNVSFSPVQLIQPIWRAGLPTIIA